MILDNNSGVQGFYKYSENREYERGDFVVYEGCIYICTAKNPTNTERNTVMGEVPSSTSENYLIYPGEKIISSEEYYDFLEGKEGKDKYVSAAALEEILSNAYFGIGNNGVITESIGDNTLDSILTNPDLNNGAFKISANLPELKSIAPTIKSSSDGIVITGKVTGVSGNAISSCKVVEYLPTGATGKSTVTNTYGEYKILVTDEASRLVFISQEYHDTEVCRVVGLKTVIDAILNEDTVYNVSGSITSADGSSVGDSTIYSLDYASPVVKIEYKDNVSFEDESSFIDIIRNYEPYDEYSREVIRERLYINTKRKIGKIYFVDSDTAFDFYRNLKNNLPGYIENIYLLGVSTSSEYYLRFLVYDGNKLVKNGTWTLSDEGTVVASGNIVNGVINGPSTTSNTKSYSLSINSDGYKDYSESVTGSSNKNRTISLESDIEYYYNFEFVVLSEGGNRSRPTTTNWEAHPQDDASLVLASGQSSYSSITIGPSSYYDIFISLVGSSNYYIINDANGAPSGYVGGYTTREKAESHPHYIYLQLTSDNGNYSEYATNENYGEEPETGGDNDSEEVTPPAETSGVGDGTTIGSVSPETNIIATAYSKSNSTYTLTSGEEITNLFVKTGGYIYKYVPVDSSKVDIELTPKYNQVHLKLSGINSSYDFSKMKINIVSTEYPKEVLRFDSREGSYIIEVDIETKEIDSNGNVVFNVDISSLEPSARFVYVSIKFEDTYDNIICSNAIQNSKDSDVIIPVKESVKDTDDFSAYISVDNTSAPGINPRIYPVSTKYLKQSMVASVITSGDDSYVIQNNIGTSGNYYKWSDKFDSLYVKDTDNTLPMLIPIENGVTEIKIYPVSSSNKYNSSDLVSRDISTLIVRQYTYLDEVNSENGYVRVQEIIDPQYSNIYFRYIISGASDSIKFDSDCRKSSWKKINNTSEDVKAQLEGILNYYNNRLEELRKEEEQLKLNYRIKKAVPEFSENNSSAIIGLDDIFTGNPNTGSIIMTVIVKTEISRGLYKTATVTFDALDSYREASGSCKYIFGTDSSKTSEYITVVYKSVDREIQLKAEGFEIVDISYKSNN